MKLRFLGTLTHILGPYPQTLNQFGQAFEATPEQVADIHHEKGIAAIPEEDFTAIFPDGKVDPRAPDLATQKQRAFQALAQMRAQAAARREKPAEPAEEGKQ
jgi:hypothetical protein